METKEKLRVSILDKVKRLPEDRLSDLDVFLDDLETQLMSKNDPMTPTLLGQIEKGLRDVKKIQEGKEPKKTLTQFLNEQV